MYRGFICDVFHHNHKKNCLFVYITAPFISHEIDSHAAQAQALEIAKIFDEYGYNVDVLDFVSKDKSKLRKYDLIFHVDCTQIEELYPYMNNNCKLIGYLTGANLVFSNEAIKKRAQGIFDRRGRRLQARRTVEKVYTPEIMSRVDAFFLMGNEYILSTYSDLPLKRVFFIVNSGMPQMHPVQCGDKKDPKSFLFFAGGGQVLKGLDIALEVFSRNQDLTLYICSPFRSERDFCQLYHKELFETNNIKPIGVVDVREEKFQYIAERCAYHIAPSCTEGMCGSVLTTMQAGIIPVMTKECGVDNPEGIYLESVDINYINTVVRELAQKDSAWIQQKALQNMEVYKQRYSMEQFCESFRKACEHTL